MPDPLPSDEAIITDALAIGEWYGTTHGDCFEHDHHCPARSKKKRTKCSCGWSKALPALERLAELWRNTR